MKTAIPWVLGACLALASCAARPPEAEVMAANTAFAEAQDAQAPSLAPASYKVASDANVALQANLNARDYRRTKPLAKALLEASQKARSDAAAGLELARAAVAQLGADLGEEIGSLQKTLAKVSAKKPKLDLKAAKAAIAAAPADLALALSLSDPVAAKSRLLGLRASLEAYAAALEAP